MRKHLINLLDTAWRADKSELVLLSGRRRSGKTHLVKSLASGKATVYLPGEMLPPRELLSQFWSHFRQFAAALPEAQKPGKGRDEPREESWESLVSSITDIGRIRKILIVFDEFQHTASAYPQVTELIRKAWDKAWKTSKNHFLILSSSDLAFMKSLTDGYRAPFFGRSTRDPIQLEPPGFYQSSTLSKFRSADRIGTYAILGGVPLYHGIFSDKDELNENIQKRLLSPGSFLLEEPRRLLLEDLREPKNFMGILSALAAGKDRMRDIVEHTGLEKGMVSRYLDVLRERGLVVRELPIAEKPSGSRKGRYRIKDNLLKFYLRFIVPNRSLIEMGRQDTLFTKIIRPHLDSFIAEGFHLVFREYMEKLNEEGKLLWKFNRAGSWWDKDDFISFVATDGRDKYWMGDCTWEHKQQGREFYEDLRRKAALLKLKKKPKVYLALLSRGGYKLDLRRDAKEHGVQTFELKDISPPR